ncbi:MAG: hypothetical protein KC484_02245 [Colwelliaceae bacterium]|jgi:hypothetical protein|nr:hypothetical protein [Colwelliaceae bacterium]
MQFSTPEALHKIIGANNKKIMVDGHQSCPLNAMSVAFNYHTIDINETSSSLSVKGVSPVVRNDKFLIK